MRSLPDSISSVYGHDGPFVTAYLDATRATENGAHELELRWRELRKDLADGGASEADLSAIEATLTEPLQAGGRHGRVVVSANGEILLNEVLAEPPARSRACVGALPDLVPFAAANNSGTPYVLVVADHAGADLVSVPAGFAAAGIRPGASSVDSSDELQPAHERPDAARRVDKLTADRVGLWTDAQHQRDPLAIERRIGHGASVD